MIVLTLLAALYFCSLQTGAPVAQTSLPRIDQLIWLDSSGRNFDQVTFGLYTVIGDARQGPKRNNGEFHEALTSLNSVLSAGWLKIDKTSQNGCNYVRMAQNYLNSDNQWHIGRKGVIADNWGDYAA